MKRFVFLPLSIAFVLGFVLYSQGHAQTYELRGNLREWVKIFNESPNETDLLETRLKLELLSTLGENTAFRAINYYVYDGVQKSHDWTFQEAYIDYYSKLLDIRFGKQIIAWGKADEINPTDVLNPQNLANITEDKSVRKIGLLCLKTDWKFSDYVLEGIWKPEFQEMQIPSLNSRWAFFSLPGVTELPSPSYPDNELGDTEWALKLSRTFSMYDFSVSYFDGWDNIFTPNLVFNSDTQQIELDELVFHRTKMFGADFAGSIRSVGVWGEFAYFRTEDTEGTDSTIKNPYLQYVVGADYTFGYNITANVQYFQQYITKIDDDAEETSEEDMISKLGIGMPLQQAVSLRIAKKFGEGDVHKLELFGLYDLKHQGMMLQPKLVISPEDALSLEIGTVIYDGDEESIFGRFDANDEVYLKCTYSF
jgi:hypothetical protein